MIAGHHPAEYRASLGLTSGFLTNSRYIIYSPPVRRHDYGCRVVAGACGARVADGGSRVAEAARLVWRVRADGPRSVLARCVARPHVTVDARRHVDCAGHRNHWCTRESCASASARATGGGGVMSVRPVKKVLGTTPALEGAGVKLQRAFGFGDTTEFDPFLLLDDFRNENPDDYLAGFSWHPHRGIETITYVLAGQVAHGDSLGNRGSLGAGDVQWMTAGSGILHQEMPHGDAQGRMH